MDQPPPPTTDTTLDPQPQPLPPKLRLMCSYNGHIVPRLHDKTLCYVGGDTRMVVIPRTTTLSDLLSRLSKTLLNHVHHGGFGFTLKYQLPTEDLDSLISVSTDEDLDNMIDEYDRLSKSAKPSRIRLFLFPVQPETAHSMGPILDGSNRSEDWFLNALNGVQELQRGFSDPAINCLVQDMKPGNGTGTGEKKGAGTGQDVHSVPDSPVIGNTSSFGSTSSPPSFMNLPPIRVHVEQKSGIEEQFAQMGVSTGGGGGGQEGVLGVASGAGRGYSEDDRSDHGGVVGFLKQQQMGTGGGGMNKQQQQQQQQFGGDLASPDSVSSDNSLSGAFARQKPVMYQDPNGQSSTGSNSNSNRPPQSMQMQQVSESGYPYHPQYEQHQQQMLQRHQHQQQQQQQHHQHQQQHLLQQQQQQQQQHGQTQQPTQQQYVQSGGQFLQHHPGSVPVPSYYPVYPSQQQPQPHHPQQYQVYYMPAGQAQGYSLQGQQQQNMGEGPTSASSNRTQMSNNPTMMTNASPYNPSRNMNMPPPKSEAGPGLYRTAANAVGGAAQRVQVPSGQHQLPSQSQPQPQPQQQQQFMGYSQMNHPSQSTASNMGAASGYAYDPAHAQVYYTQAPGLASQYQGVTSSGPSMMMSDVSSQISNESGK